MGTAWLRCAVKPSTLGGEVAVIVTTVDGSLVSFFVPADLVKRASSRNEEGEIRVQVVERDSDTGVVFLPRRTFEGTNVAKVWSRALSFA